MLVNLIISKQLGWREPWSLRLVGEDAAPPHFVGDAVQSGLAGTMDGQAARHGLRLQRGEMGTAPDEGAEGVSLASQEYVVRVATGPQEDVARHLARLVEQLADEPLAAPGEAVLR